MGDVRSALVTNMTPVGGPPAVYALVVAGFRILCRNSSFGKPGARRR